ncbi:MAG: hypothetical protein LBD96_03795 [Treponema sp.]|nr:hypothetical protein [Treponema sp.]
MRSRDGVLQRVVYGSSLISGGATAPVADTLALRQVVSPPGAGKSLGETLVESASAIFDTLTAHKVNRTRTAC